MILRALLIVILCAVCFAGCAEERKQPQKLRFVQYLVVEGDCREDHVIKGSHFSGDIEHKYDEEKKKDVIFGFLMRSDFLDIEKIISEATAIDKQVYEPPSFIYLLDISRDEIKNDSILTKGLAVMENNKDSDATCKLAITKRFDREPSKEERWSMKL